MAGSNLDMDEEPPKQLPLNEEEVVIFKAYLEQWNSMFGKEQNVVWEDATKEARLKAPPIDAPLLKARKKTYWSVIESLRKKELLKKIKDETGVKAGEYRIMNHYSKYLTEMMDSLTEKEIKENKQGVPPEVQADIVRRRSDDILLHMAKKMFKRNEKSKLMVSSHNYNDEVGKGESFSQTSDWQMILLKWEAYARRQFDANNADDLVVKRGRKNNTYTLDMGNDGFSILPDHVKINSDTWKAVVRAFLNWYYHKSANVNRLDGLKIWEPLRINRHKATELLDFWYDRQQTGQDVVFEFYG
ncbi:hypothetical protein EDD22DRAFT_844276 [Suillus occidentalis]|nr:hypothetical protein EDD22DRAFT_844276 [Suillus occidentalis]